MTYQQISTNAATLLGYKKTAHASVRPGLGLLNDFTWTLFGNGIFSACQWGIIIILAKMLTAEVVGQYSLSQAIVAPVLTLTAFQLRGVVASDLKRQFTTSEYFVFRLFTLAAGLLIAMVIALFSTKAVTQVLMIGIVSLTQCAELTSDTLYGFSQRRGDLVRPAISMISKGLVGLLALAAGIAWMHSALFGLAGLAATRIVLLAGYDLRIFVNSRTQQQIDVRSSLNWRRHVQLLRLVSFIGIMAMLSALIAVIPRYFVEGYLGSRALGVFAAISSLIAIGLMPVGALGVAAFVRFARAFVDRNAREFFKILSILVALSLVLGAGGVAVAYIGGAQILTLLFRREYAAYTDLLRLTMIIGAVTFVTASLGSSLTAARIYKPQVVILAAVGIAEALGCWILIPAMGLNGAAVACLVAASVQLIGTGWVLMRQFVGQVPRAATSPAVS